MQANGKNYNWQYNLRTLLCLIFLDQTALTITFPLVTFIFFDTQTRLFSEETSHAVRSMWYGFCVALPQLINMFFAPLLSALSDHFGRKKILMIEISSAMFFTLTVALGIYLGNIIFVFLGYLIRGAFSRTNPTALSMIGDMTPRDKKILYMGYLQFAISIGACLGPMIGGYFAKSIFFSQLNFSFPLLIAASIALGNSLLTFYFIKETLINKPHHQQHQLSWSAIKTILLHKDVLRISLMLLLIQISWSTYYQFAPPILKTIYHAQSSTLGFFIGMIAFWLAIASSIILKLLHRLLDVQKILYTACYLLLFGLMMTIVACNFFPTNHFLMWIAAAPVAAGDVIAYSSLTALYSNAVSSEGQGKTMGLSFIIVGCAWSFTGLIGGFAMSIIPTLPLSLAPLGVICALFLLRSSFGKRLVLNYIG